MLFQKIAGETVLLPNGSSSVLGEGFILNRIAVRVSELMGESRPIAEIARMVAAEYGLDDAAALAETQEIIDSLQADSTVAGPRQPRSR